MIPRHIAPTVREALADRPVVLVNGARQVGKSTLVRALLGSARYLTLDEPAVLAAASADPAGFVAGLPEAAVLDEVQRVPTLFPAIKLAVDRDRRPGLLAELQAWRLAYRVALATWRSGERAVEFPVGSYALPRFHGARVIRATGPPVLG